MDSGLSGEHMDLALEHVEEEFSWQKGSAAALFQKMEANTVKACVLNIAPAIWSHANIQVSRMDFLYISSTRASVSSLLIYTRILVSLYFFVVMCP